ncbi:NADPH-dependent glutamate synthase [Thermoproteota archaeon]
MFEIIDKKTISDTLKQFEVFCPLLTSKARAGQFIILRIREGGERIPLTIADYDKEKGTITLVVQEVGKTTMELGLLKPGDVLLDLTGPLGHPSKIAKFGTVLCIGGGLGVAPIYPIARELKSAGNYVISIIGVRTKNQLFWEDKLKVVSDELYVVTNDGSYGQKGLVTALQKEILKKQKIDKLFTVGPSVMMKAVVDISRPYSLSTIVSLDSLMVDGTGMCGSCRVSVKGVTKFACVDGPEFEGLDVDFDNLLSRKRFYKDEEHESIFGNRCKLEDEQSPHKRQKMPEQNPVERITNFKEVALGYSEEQAVLEASRCLQCKTAPCMKGCPVRVDIPGFIKLITERNFIKAAEKILETNVFPAVCGRVCPQETQCEALCVLGKKGDPIAIGRLERFAADYERLHRKNKVYKPYKQIGKKVAVIGAGPAGLTCAAELAKQGVEVTVYEAFHKGGGVLVYGIPTFRLPREVVKDEIQNLEKQGVKLKLNMVIERILSLDEIFEKGYAAIFIGVGAGLPAFLNIPGEDLAGVYSANEFLTRINLMKAYNFPFTDTPVKMGERVAVIGGGNVAMDAARAARRLGADVFLIYRRTREEMPARYEESVHAQEEGIHFQLLTTPVEIVGDEEQKVTAVSCLRMVLGKPDESGRKRPVAIKGSEFDIRVDSVIIAIGTKPNPLLTRQVEHLELTQWGNIKVLDKTGRTSLPNVWAGGDIVTGAATVIEAMGAGQRAAEEIFKHIH